MEKAREIKHLLVKTVQNHHEYQENQLGGDYNNDWSKWYADFLLENDLVEVWGREITAEELAATLRQLDEEYKAEEREENWPTYYAGRMVEM
ncbi:MAG: hypothetical protein OEV06_00870 [Anaerolineae bacterium]|nr:hypothetical protein [Anaerolineae bacterium]